MLKKEKSAISRILLLAFLATIIIIIAISVFYKAPPNQKSLVSLKASLEPSTIKVGENSRLTLEFENQDLASHQISCKFTTNQKVTIYSGNDPLTENEYSFVLEASVPTEERILIVNALLEDWISSSKYKINVSLYIDGNEIMEESQELTLTVKES
jgi:hypothetical protein